MINPYNDDDYHGAVYKSVEEVTPVCTNVIWPIFIKQLGSRPSVMFPEFAKAFPLTINAIESNWPLQTKIYASTFLPDSSVVYQIILERKDKNLIFNNPRRVGQLFTEDLFNERRAMVPIRWKELYRWFDSFAITEGLGGYVSKNTPFDHSSRLGYEGFRDRYPIKKIDFTTFEKAIGSNRMRCWLDTDAGDSLWLDEQNCDHKVYHTKNGNLEDYFVLPMPENTLDEYLAHYVSGSDPADFDFRA